MSAATGHTTDSPRRLRRRRHLSWGVADQALSSLTNFGVGVFAARTLDARGFGAFGLVFTIYLFGLSGSRALHAEPLTVRFSAGDRGAADAVQASAGSSLLLGTAIGAVCGLASLLAPPEVAICLTALFFVMPGLLLQDHWRFVFFAQRAGRDAFRNDLIWTILQILAFVLLLTFGSKNAGHLVFAWGLSATAAAGFGALQARAVPRLSGAADWWREQRDIAVPFLAEVMLRNVMLLGPIFVATSVNGLAASAALRGADILLGPAKILMSGSIMTAQPEARLLRTRPKQLKLFLILMSCGVTLAAIANAVIAWWLPDRVGTSILGAAWPGARDLVLIVGASLAAAGSESGAAVGLRALAAAKESLVARAFVACIAAILLAAGVFIGTTEAIATFAAAAAALSALVYWYQLGRASRRHHSGTDFDHSTTLAYRSDG